ncbi:hypothetical protein Q6D67_10270 [Haliea sp. E1-2-M8]|uniref:hypothetical protein n=1 Tax=Haliea sp. E1-2-M8 TaxID=3064706 RepID=UPI0027251D43|nr:hypothetical protein [Haliea sp. E1-2-M8]MDO8862088.1 hypothetical protein [Haliea sp. E1-2-M8]
MKLLKTVPLLPIAIGAVIVTGCASKPAEPTVADRMRGHAADIQREADLKSSLAQQWEQGGALIATGTRRVDEGERRMREAEREMEKARAQVARGRNEVSEGEQLVEDAEQKFRQEFPELKLN